MGTYFSLKLPSLLNSWSVSGKSGLLQKRNLRSFKKICLCSSVHCRWFSGSWEACSEIFCRMYQFKIRKQFGKWPVFLSSSFFISILDAIKWNSLFLSRCPRLSPKSNKSNKSISFGVTRSCCNKSYSCSPLITHSKISCSSILWLSYFLEGQIPLNLLWLAHIHLDFSQVD